MEPSQEDLVCPVDSRENEIRQFGEPIRPPRTRKCGINLSSQVVVYFEKL